MVNNTESLDILVNKLKVLESKIRKLEAQTEEVLNEVETEFHQHIHELQHKKIVVQQKLSEIQNKD